MTVRLLSVTSRRGAIIDDYAKDALLRRLAVTEWLGLGPDKFQVA